MHIYLRFILGLSGLAIVACADEAWDAAEEEDTIAAYETYIEQNPDARRAADARARIVAIEWDAAKESDDLSVIAAFVERHPDNPFRAEADAVVSALHAAESEAFNESFDQDLMDFLSFKDGNWTKVMGETRGDLPVSRGIISGGFDIIGGVAIPYPTSEVVYEHTENMFKVSGMVGNGGRLVTISSAEFQSGATIELASGSIFEYRDGAWARAEAAPE